MTTLTTGLATSFITFSRPGASGGGATVTDRDGRIKWAGHNLLLASESFDSSSWSKGSFATVAANTEAAPNSTTTADTITTSNVGHAVSQAVAVTAGASYTFAFWAKRGTMTDAKYSVFDNTNAANIVAATSYYSSINASTWTLVTVSFTAPAGCAQVAVYVLRDSGVTGTIHLWGAHLYRSDMQMQLNPAQPAGMQSYYPTTPRNLLGFTEDFGNNTVWPKSGSMVSVGNSAIAPNGLLTADKLVAVSGAGAKSMYYNGANISSAPMTISVYAKAAEYSLLQFHESANGQFYVSFNLATGAVVAGSSGGSKYVSSAITAVGDGWYRCSMVISGVTTSAAPAFAGYPAGATLSAYGPSYTGDGVSGIYLWGAQLSDSASLDTYVPHYGAAVTSAAYYAPRLDFDGATLAARGLLVEELRTNIALYTADFTNAAWVKGNAGSTDPVVTANQDTAPDGTLTADKVDFGAIDAAGDYSVISDVFTAEAAAYAGSVYVKAATAGDVGKKVWAYFYDTAIKGVASVTLTTSWQRLVSTGTLTAGASRSLNIGTIGSTTGGENQAAVSVHLWGGQVEKGAFATSYIPNIDTSAGVTRAADVASVSTGAFPYSATEGTLVASGSFLSGNVATDQMVVQLDNGSTSQRHKISRYSGGIYGTTTVTTPQADITLVAASSAGIVYKAAYAFKANDFAGTVNGGTVATYGSGNMPTGITDMRLGKNWNAFDYLNGHIRQITYLPRRISNAELISRTS